MLGAGRERSVYRVCSEEDLLADEPGIAPGGDGGSARAGQEAGAPGFESPEAHAAEDAVAGEAHAVGASFAPGVGRRTDPPGGTRGAPAVAYRGSARVRLRALAITALACACGLLVGLVAVRLISPGASGSAPVAQQPVQPAVRGAARSGAPGRPGARVPRGGTRPARRRPWRGRGPRGGHWPGSLRSAEQGARAAPQAWAAPAGGSGGSAGSAVVGGWASGGAPGAPAELPEAHAREFGFER